MAVRHPIPVFFSIFLQTECYPQRFPKSLHRLLNRFRARRRESHAEEDVIVVAWLNVGLCAGPAPFCGEYAAVDTSFEDLLLDF